LRAELPMGSWGLRTREEEHLPTEKDKSIKGLFEAVMTAVYGSDPTGPIASRFRAPFQVVGISGRLVHRTVSI